MKTKSLFLFLAAATLLAGCSTSSASSSSKASSEPASSSSQPASESSSKPAESSPAPSSEVSTESSVESSVESSIESSPEVKVLATLAGRIDLYGMFSVDVTLVLNENKTGAYTLAYSGTDPFTYDQVTWNVDDNTGYIVANIITVTAEGAVSSYAATVYAAGETYFGYVPTNLGSCLISNAELSEVVAVSGQTVMDYGSYGKFTCDASINLLSKGLALYTIAYTTESAQGTDVQAISLPTSWATDETTGVSTINLFAASPEGEVSVVPTPIYFGGSQAVEFAAIKIESNLGDFYATNGKAYLATMRGSTSVDYGPMGQFSCAYTVALFDGWALITADYGSQGNFTAAYAMTANEDKTQYTIAGFVWGSDEQGNPKTQDVTVANNEGVYTATLTSGLGDIEVTSAQAA